MPKQLQLELWNDTLCDDCWETFPTVDRDRVIDLYTRLCVRSVRGEECVTPDADDKDTQEKRQ